MSESDDVDDADREPDANPIPPCDGSDRYPPVHVKTAKIDGEKGAIFRRHRSKSYWIASTVWIDDLSDEI